MVFLFGIITIIQSNLAFAASSEKISLVQKFEQFPGQEITGVCYLQYDEEGNLDWRIKVNGLEPETRGHFDLDHWAGEIDVPFTADDNGKADSKNNFIPVNNISHSLCDLYSESESEEEDEVDIIYGIVQKSPSNLVSGNELEESKLFLISEITNKIEKMSLLELLKIKETIEQ